MRTLKLALPAAILITGFMVCTSTSYGKAEYAKKEGKSCAYCHVKMGSKDLNEIGKCYKDANHSLATCKAPEKK